MKKILCLISLSSILLSQDTLTAVGNVQYYGKVIEVRDYEVEFLREGAVNSQVIPKWNIINIKMGDGTLLDFSDITENPDVLTSVGNAQYNGKVIEVRENQIVFLPEGATNPQVIPKWNIISIQMSDGTVLDYSDFTKIPAKMMSEEEQKRIAREREIKEQCESNSKLKFMVIPFKDDYYAVTEEIESYLDTLCYSVQDNFAGLEYLSNQKVSGDDINDFHLISIGKELKLNFVVYGYTYTVEEPFNYAGNPSATAPFVPLISRSENTLFDALLNTLILSGVSAAEEKMRSQASSESGTYLGVTFFQIDVNTGEKKFIVNNSRARKL